MKSEFLSLNRGGYPQSVGGVSGQRPPSAAGEACQRRVRTELVPGRLDVMLGGQETNEEKTWVLHPAESRTRWIELVEINATCDPFDLLVDAPQQTCTFTKPWFFGAIRQFGKQEVSDQSRRVCVPQDLCFRRSLS